MTSTPLAHPMKISCHPLEKHGRQCQSAWTPGHECENELVHFTALRMCSLVGKKLCAKEVLIWWHGFWCWPDTSIMAYLSMSLGIVWGSSPAAKLLRCKNFLMVSLLYMWSKETFLRPPRSWMSCTTFSSCSSHSCITHYDIPTHWNPTPIFSFCLFHSQKCLWSIIEVCMGITQWTSLEFIWAFFCAFSSTTGNLTGFT